VFNLLKASITIQLQLRHLYIEVRWESYKGHVTTTCVNETIPFSFHDTFVGISG